MTKLWEMRSREDSGFTLIEVLIVVVVLPLVIGAIALGFITLLQNKDATSQRFSDSHDAQIASAFFVRDVKSADTVSTSSVSICSKTSYLVGFSWSSLNSSGTSVTNASVYTIDATAGTIDRTSCTTSSSSVTVVHNSIPLASGATVTSCPASGIGVGATKCAVANGTPYAAVTVSCGDGTTTCANSGATATTPTTTNSGVKSVALNVLENVSKFTFNVNASPSEWNSGFAGTPGGGSGNLPALELIGTNSSASLSGSSSCSLTVNGVASFDSTTSPSVDLGNNGSLTATGGIYTVANPPASGGTVNSPSTTQGPPLGDPYVTLTPPSTSDAGVHVISTSNWSPVGILDGVYIVQAGMKLASGAVVTTGPDGVLIYVTAGNVDLTGGASVSLTKPVTSPKNYSPIVLWMANAGTVSLGGTGTLDTIGGTVYVPQGTVSLQGGGSGGGVSAGAIVTKTLDGSGCGSSAGYTAGPTGTCTTISANPNPANDGSTSTLTATVTDCKGNAVTSGKVGFSIKTKGGATTSDCPDLVALNGSGQATCTTGQLSSTSAPYTIQAAYQGNTNFGPSSSSAVSLVVYVPTTTTVTSSAPSGSVSGQSVTFTATVTPGDGSTATGTVTFAIQATGNNGNITCTGGNTKTLSNGSATCTVTTLVKSGSPYTITATYPVTGTLAGSSGTLQQTVTQASTTTTVTASNTPSRPSAAVTFTATVAPVPDGGTVTWSIKDKNNLIVAQCLVPVAVSNTGTATCAVQSGTFTLANGPYSVTATYSGDVNYGGSTGNLSQTIGAVTTTSVGSFAKSNNNYTSTITVTAADGSTPSSGTVNFYLCANTTTGCTPSSSTLFNSKTLGNGGTVTSQNVNGNGLTVGAHYCFAVVYLGVANQYQGSQDTSATNQCFTR